MSKFVHLHAHTSIGSMQDAMTNVYDMFKKASELGQKSLAITDHGTIAAAFDARRASLKYGVKYIPGCEAYFVDDVSVKKKQRRHIVLLAKNEKGYRNLLSLNYEGYTHNEYVPILGRVFPRVDWEILEKYSEGIICMTACGSGILSTQMFNYDDIGEWNESACDTDVSSIIVRLKKIFGEDLYLELQPHDLKVFHRSRKTGDVIKTPLLVEKVKIDQAHINRKLVGLAEQHDIKMVATADVHYLTRGDAKIHDMLMAINSKKPLNDPLRHRYDVEEFYMKSYDDIMEYFSDHFNKDLAQELCDNSLEIANKCEDSKYLDVTEVRFPKFDCSAETDYQDFIKWSANQKCNGIAEDCAFMRYRCVKGFKKNYGHLKGEKRKLYIKRMQDEVKVLEERNFSSYMLIVSDFIIKAKERKIPVGPGRGCVTGDTLVLSKFGFTPIKNIKSGDFVYSHTGKLRKVKNIFKYPVQEDLIKIKTNFSFEDISYTKDHKIFGEKSRLNETYLRRKNNNFGSYKKTKKFSDPKFSAEWIKAEKLVRDDILFMPKIKRQHISTPKSIDLLSYITNENYSVDDNSIFMLIPKNNKFSIRAISKSTGLSRNAVKNAKKSGNITEITNKKISKYLHGLDTTLNNWQSDRNFYCKVINRHLKLDEDFMYFVGRWAGDGWLKISNQSNYIGIAFNKNDKDGINKISKYLNSLGFDCKYNISKNKDLTQLYVYGKILPKLMKKLIPNYKNTSNTKHFPSFFRNLSRQLLLKMIDGLIDSDGNRNNNRVSIDTTSRRLALETKEALLYLGIPAGITSRDEYLRDKKYKCKKSYKIRYNINYENSNLYSETGYYTKITEITSKKEKYVFDIEVEKDHSYVTINYAVHNSVGGSLVANLLDIHVVDPIQYGLLFERFHNIEKTSFPDIDTDFSPDGREWVKGYIVKKYGKRNTAHVSNLSRMTPKVVIKDIARSLEIGGSKSEAFKIANKITDSIPSTAGTFDEALAQSPEFMKFITKYPDIERYGRKLVGLEKAYATHAAGVVISDIDLTTYVPLRVDKNGDTSVQYDKNRCEAEGLIKMDLLGLEHLRIIDNTIKNARSLGLSCLESEVVPLDDKNVWEDISMGKTMCVFQMESAHMKSLCKQIKPKNIEDLSLVNALGRPSAGKSRAAYIARRDGKEKVTFKYECLRPALEETLGICVYEEQLAKLANCVAGWDLNKADGLRKLTKLKGKDKKLAAGLKGDFIKDAIKHSNLSHEGAIDIWENIIEPFAGYGFNKAHGVLYSINGYHSAYYKHYFPSAFMAAVLKSEVEKASSATRDSNIRLYKREAKRMGLKINAPDINKSGKSFTVLNMNTIVTGLEAIKGVGAKAVSNVLDTRDEHKFKSFSDFLYRTRSAVIKKDVIQSLAKAGCFDGQGITRKSAFTYYADLRKLGLKHAKKVAASGRDAWDVMDDLKDEKTVGNGDWNKEWNIKEKLIAEGETLGEYISGSINDLYDGFFTGNGVTPLSKLNRIASGTLIRTESVISSVIKKKLTKGRNSGKVYAKCTVTDAHNTSTQIVVWPERWAKYKESLEIGLPVRAICKVKSYNDNNTLELERIENITR